MTNWLREFRIIPVLLIAAGSLLALKTFGLVLDGRYSLGERPGNKDGLVVTTAPAAPEVAAVSSAASKSWMQDMFSYPEVTGSVAAKPKPDEKEAKKPDEKETKKPAPPPPESQPGYGERAIPLDQPMRPSSEAERALLVRLQARRQELEARARELDLRETLVKDAEKKFDDSADQKPGGAARDARPAKEATDANRMKAVVAMYEAMKPKDAAKIFDRLDMRVLIELASQIKPPLMSAILAQMSAEAAERLTVELAASGGSGRTINPSMLPKIDGRPANP
jgi:flagellar motility protein MotE (MotC chaperone)